MWFLTKYAGFSCLWIEYSLAELAILGAITGPLAVLGDLLESFVKRCGGVKVHISLSYIA